MPLLSRSRLGEPTDVALTLRSRVPLWALVASLAVVGGIHLAVGSEHDFVGVHGTFFVLAGVIQAVGAAIVARRPSRRFIGLAGLGSAALVVIWVVERTPGLPGGDALDPLAVAAAVGEVVTVVAAARLLSRPIARDGRVSGLAALASVALVAVGSVGFAGAGHGDHHHAEETVVSDGTPQNASSEPGVLRPLPPAPADDHHGSSHGDGTPDLEAVPAPATEPAPHQHEDDDLPHDH